MKPIIILIGAGLLFNMLAASNTSVQTFNQLPQQLDPSLPSLGSTAMLAGVIAAVVSVI